MERRDEAAIAFFGTWMVTGLYLDGWSHIHNKPETFFTPWHGVLYSGFGAAVVYFVARGAITGRRLEMDRSVNLGFGLFIAAAIGDFIWHTIFGIEANVAALLSPTHLGLMTGGVLMLAGPIHSAKERPARGFREFLPTIVCFTLITAVLTFFLQYAQAFRMLGLFKPQDEGTAVWLVTAVLITNALLMGVALYMKRGWKTPRGTYTLMFTAVAVAATALDGFHSLHFISAFVGGLVADYLADRDARIFGVVVPLVMWTAWVLVMGATWEVSWDVEIWTGAIFLASLTGFGLSVLAGDQISRGGDASRTPPPPSSEHAPASHR